MKSNVFKKAHELTKKIIKAGDDYRTTFRLCLSFVYSQLKKEENKMVELKGTEKQVKWANDIRETVMQYLNEVLKMQIKSSDEKGDRNGKTVEEWRERANKKFNEELSVIINNEDASFFIKNFKHIRKENDAFFLSKELQNLGIKGRVIGYLQRM